MLIETPIDELARIVAEKKKITIGEAARLLKTNETQIEEWVRILEEHGFVELIYPAFGEPQIILKKIEKEDLVKKKKELETKKQAVEEKTKEFEKKVERVEKKIEISNKEFSKLENELKDKLKGLDKNIKIIDKLESKKAEVVKRAEEAKFVADSLNKEVEGIRAEISEMENKINEHIKTMEEHEIDIKNLDESKKVIENEIMNLEKEVNLIKLLVKRPIMPPMINLKNIFSRHKERSEEIKEKRKKLHEKALKMQNVLSQKKKVLKR